MAAVSCSWLTLPSKMRGLTLTSSSSSSSSISNSASLSFSRNVSHSVLTQGSLSLRTVQRQRRGVVVCEAAPPKQKVDSAVKRAHQAEKRRLYNKARKSEIRTRTKKVLEALDLLKKKPDAQAEEITRIEKMIGEAYSVIDKAVKVGTLHRNTGANRKSRLARRKKAVELHHGWYTPVPEGRA